MSRTIRAFALTGLLLATGASSAQQIIFFEQPDFNGRRFGANESVSNMSTGGFNDRASSVVVRSGNWQLCTDAYFRGRCVSSTRAITATSGRSASRTRSRRPASSADRGKAGVAAAGAPAARTLP